MLCNSAGNYFFLEPDCFSQRLAAISIEIHYSVGFKKNP
jgi:hypothetical protein